MTRIGALVCYVVLLFDVSNGFIPNQRRKILTPTSITHKQMTENAVREMARIFMNDYPELYPDQEEAMATDDFKKSVEHFRDAVAKPDLEQPLKDLPAAHFDAEQIVAGNQRLLTERVKVISAITGRDMTAARDITGQLLHTLQDFYSHTNWVEIGNNGIHSALGDPGKVANIGKVATPDEPTCTNCQDPDYKTCRNNIRSEINSAGILTSGYVLIKVLPIGDSDPSQYKPEGKNKCSHGGSFDETVDIPGTGGINKDSNSDSYSPHHYLHPQAARLAEEATLEFLKGIRQVREEEEFAKYLGLEQGASLCFVVDTTGSMSDEIDAVRKTTIRITQESLMGPNKPTDFILAPFNDPSVGPLTKTESAETMINALRGLSANGGGDGPELFYGGLLLALRNVRPGSTCYTFTDAPAKDASKALTAIALAVANKIKVNVVFTSGGRRRRRSTRRHKRGVPDYYTELAMASGGQVIDTPNADIDETVKVVDVGLSATQVTIVQKDKLVGSSLHSIPVDETLSSLVIAVTGAIDNIVINNPSGLIEIPDVVNSSATVVQVTNIPSLKLYTVATPSPGTWILNISATGSYSLRVTAQSLVDFAYQFVEDVDTGHGGYRPVDGKPLAGQDVIVVVQIFGGAMVKGIADVTGLVFVEEDGKEVRRLELFELETMKEYESSAVLPNNGFRVLFEGVDKQGNKIQRLNTAIVTTAKNTVHISLNGTGSYDVVVGESVEVTISVTNSEDLNVTYSLTISDSRSYFQSVTPSMLVVNKNTTGIALATFTAPDDAGLGQVSSVSVVASSQDSTDENFIVFRLSTIAKNPDITAPVCNITNTTGDCSMTKSGALPCTDDHWYVSFTTQDTGLGLYAVRTRDNNDNATFRVGNFSLGETGAVDGEYSSNCCVKNVSIVASDIVGNAGRCEVMYDDKTRTSKCESVKHSAFVMIVALLYFIMQ